MFTVAAARFKNMQRMTGRTDLGKSKEYKTLAAAVQHGISGLVKERDGHNFCVILGPQGQCHYRTI